MNKFKYYFILLLAGISLISCSKKDDDDVVVVPLRDYAVHKIIQGVSPFFC